MYRLPGPMCTVHGDWPEIDEGTLARQYSPLPGILGREPVCREDDTSRPKTLTAEDILKIAPTAGQNAGILAVALNQATSDAGITTRIGQAMLIAQCAEESAGFAGQEFVETGVQSRVVFNAGANIGAPLKVKAIQTGRFERYLQGHNVALWRASRDKFLKAKAAYEKANPDKKFEAATGDAAWRATELADYLPGDEELPYWKLWYDPASPHAGRSRMAKANGNVEPGDGLKYIGRGFIQLTWRGNYRAAGTALKLELEKNPDAAAELDNAIRIAAWYWKSRSLNQYTKEDTSDNFKKVTRKINPGLAGLAERQAYYKKAKAALGLEHS
jgi:predicted chitinase